LVSYDPVGGTSQAVVLDTVTGSSQVVQAPGQQLFAGMKLPAGDTANPDLVSVDTAGNVWGYQLHLGKTTPTPIALFTGTPSAVVTGAFGATTTGPGGIAILTQSDTKVGVTMLYADGTGKFVPPPPIPSADNSMPQDIIYLPGRRGGTLVRGD